MPTIIRVLVRRLPYPIRLTLRRLWRGPGIFNERYVIANNSRVTVYTDDSALARRCSPTEPLGVHLGKRAVRISLIAPVKNEAANAAQWCESIARQTRLPDEIIVTDAASRDGTLEILRTFAATIPTRFEIIVEPGCNIARARNLAIARAQYPIIAASDFGCRPESDWLEKLVAPFEANRHTQVVAGLYTPVDHKGRPKWQGFSIYPNLNHIDPADFLPSNRSIAFTKQAWQAVGGYPEWLTRTGEDSYFDRELQRCGGDWAFVPEARVQWFAPPSFAEYLRKVFEWTQGDGESGLHASFYWRYILQLTSAFLVTLASFMLGAIFVAMRVEPAALWIALIAALYFGGAYAVSRVSGTPLHILFVEPILELTHLTGFLTGSLRRNEALKRRLATVSGVVFILSGVPVDDTGGGARCTQLAMEFLRRNFAVVFIHKFPKYESKEQNLRIAHPNLFNYSILEFRWDRFLRAEGQLLDRGPVAAIIEFPLVEFLPLIRKIRARQGVVVYDLIDAWDTSLGGKWYSRETENEIIAASQVLIATAPTLVERLKESSGSQVTLVPNAVNQRLFDSSRSYARPADMPCAEWTAFYVGALWGEWFDWDLVRAIARENPEAAIIVIGDYRGQCQDAPNNLHFLGLKAQHDVPAYLAHADVAIVPWKISAITHATSPLKVYEYLAMRKPVVAPAIASLVDFPGVSLAHDQAEFLAKLHEARRMPFPTDRVTEFVAANNWQARVDEIINRIEAVKNEPKAVLVYEVA